MRKNLVTLCFSILFLFGCGQNAETSPIKVELFETPNPYWSGSTISKVRVTAISETADVSINSVTVNKGNCVRPHNNPFVSKTLGYGQSMEGMYFANKKEGGDCKVLLVEVDTSKGIWSFNF
ncbi:hypothetical protein [Budvicia aquatica]|uniref:Lipoprotein n=1 Tax=Budvicia aquatica TaxID=82979 RepID=A0A2C6DG28_9GAMM|nr:hypothetical protein [Budvicia aquatica]PHI30156.1 hypothetical protein CRN84_12805 [Budvicia aquatica]